MAEKKEIKPPALDLSTLFFKDKPFTNLVVASLGMGLAVGSCGWPLGPLGMLAIGAGFACFTFLAFGAMYLLAPTIDQGQKHKSKTIPQRSQALAPGCSPEPELKRKTGTELMERGNQAATPGRER